MGMETMVTNRDRTTIVKAVLEHANVPGGTTKTRIMHLSQVSFIQLGKYLEYLTTLELLELDEKTKLYNTTPKGKELLKKLDDIFGTLHLDSSLKHKKDDKRIKG